MPALVLGTSGHIHGHPQTPGHLDTVFVTAPHWVGPAKPFYWEMTGGQYRGVKSPAEEQEAALAVRENSLLHSNLGEFRLLLGLPPGPRSQERSEAHSSAWNSVRGTVSQALHPRLRAADADALTTWASHTQHSGCRAWVLELRPGSARRRPEGRLSQRGAWRCPRGLQGPLQVSSGALGRERTSKVRAHRAWCSHTPSHQSGEGSRTRAGLAGQWGEEPWPRLHLGRP